MRRTSLVLLVGVALGVLAPRPARAGLAFEYHAEERAAEDDAALSALRRELEAGGEFLATPARLRPLLGAAASAPAIRDRALTPADLLAHISVGYKAYLDGRFEQAIPQLVAAIDEGHANPALLASAPTYRAAMLDALVGLAGSYHRRNRHDDRAQAQEVMQELIRSFPEKLASLRDAYGPEPDALARAALKQLQARGTGSLVVSVDVADALIVVNEAAQPVNAMFQANLPPGVYRVMVKRPSGEVRRFDAQVTTGQTTKLQITWAQARALTASERWVGFVGIPEDAAVGHALALARRHRHGMFALLTTERAGGQRAVRATLYRARDGQVARAHRITLGPDMPARMKALARVVRLGAQAKEPQVETLPLGPAVRGRPAPSPPGDAADADGAVDEDAPVAGERANHRTTWLVAAGFAGALGVAGLGAAGYYALDARQAGEDLRTTCAVMCTSEQARAFEDAQARSNRRALIAGIAGGVGVAAAVTLWLLAPARVGDAEIAVAPMAGGGLLTYGFTF